MENSPSLATNDSLANSQQLLVYFLIISFSIVASVLVLLRLLAKWKNDATRSIREGEYFQRVNIFYTVCEGRCELMKRLQLSLIAHW